MSVEVGEASACARLTDASVFCWGDGSHGQLGPAARGASDTPVRVEGLPPAATLTLAVTRACASDPQGQLWCWGAREPGIADAGSPRRVTHMGAAAQAAGASDATCARLARGGVCCWGSNAGGLIGAVIRPFSRPAAQAELPVPMAW